MAFFMRFCKKLSLLLLVFCTLSIAAENSSIVIKNAELLALDEQYTLEANTEIVFDAEIEEAINKGVPLHFLIEFQVFKPRKYWFDDEVITKSSQVSLSYHALTRQYLVKHESQQKSYESLNEAKQALGEISAWKVFDKSLIDKDEIYFAALLIRLDQAKLPKVIQVESLASEKWNLSSQKFQWQLKELKS